jgi:hypothetical protein
VSRFRAIARSGTNQHSAGGAHSVKTLAYRFQEIGFLKTGS